MTTAKLADVLLAASRDAVRWRYRCMNALDAPAKREAIDGYNSAMGRLADVVSQVDCEALKTRSWPDSLPRYACERCGDETLWQPCPDCRDLETERSAV